MSQPESLRLADAWDQAISTRRHVSIGCEMADELRRLHAENETLKLQLLKATTPPMTERAWAEYCLAHRTVDAPPASGTLNPVTASKTVIQE